MEREYPFVLALPAVGALVARRRPRGRQRLPILVGRAGEAGRVVPDGGPVGLDYVVAVADQVHAHATAPNAVGEVDLNRLAAPRPQDERPHKLVGALGVG